ncbi:MAG TPA: flavin reductase family protein [Deltaproteobacteria bacterium]|mgnify:CR=1 FL=1|nr:hypothetical protein [Deltaproteobacteria bacterium]HCP45605.1 flavin reductase family protein [Deltaproteobacteria bacterium]
MGIAASDLSRREAYFLLIDSIVPRPVAWVSTCAPDGIPNLAPFSFFTGVTADPPTVLLSIASRVDRGEDGARSVRAKDTLANLRGQGEFIVHVSPRRFLDQVIETSGSHPPEVDEISLVGFQTVPGSWVSVPRIPQLPIAMECRLLHELDVGDPPTTVVVGEVLGWHVAEGLRDEKGRISALDWGPLGRLGVDGYQEP